MKSSVVKIFRLFFYGKKKVTFIAKMLRKSMPYLILNQLKSTILSRNNPLQGFIQTNLRMYVMCMFTHPINQILGFNKTRHLNGPVVLALK